MIGINRNDRSFSPEYAQSFDTSETFEKLLLDNLQRLSLEYGEQIRGEPIEPEIVQSFAPKIPNNLPRRDAFFGRAKEMDVVMRALSLADRTWGVLVDGIGGIGKSALAVEAAYHAQDAEAFDAFVFITAKQNILDPSGIREQTPAARTLDDFLNETARVLGQPGIAKLTGDEKRRGLLDVLRTMRALLIYDNLETLSKEEQEAMADFLRELPQGCKAIITSRRRGGEGAVWLRVEKLDWEAARGIIENEMTHDAGLANKLNRVQSRWQELFDETNGSPLALVHTLGLMRVRAALTFGGALAMLHGNCDADLQKFIFQEAHKELTTNDETALGALSFFIPSATFEAWMPVANLSRNALETTIDRLSALSLVDVLAGEERYGLHPLTRAFVRDELLADASVARETGMRFARYWMMYALQHGNLLDGDLGLIQAEWLNLVAAADWLQGKSALSGEVVKDENVASDFASLAEILLSNFLQVDNSLAKREELCERVYQTAYVLNNWYMAGGLAYDMSLILYQRGNVSDAMLWENRCVEAWGQLKSEDLQARTRSRRAQLAQKHGDVAKAERLLLEARDIWRDACMYDRLTSVLYDLSELALKRNEYDAAERYRRDAVEAEKNIRDYSA